jgi:hypothetical protein
MEIAEGCACEMDGDDYTDHEWSLIYADCEYDPCPEETEGDIRYHEMKEEGLL